ncbi:MAG: hypothetical protein KF716_26700 [Anaerolineae bacterium]|nr:hypothetical protein [Anaerolineae bacterium]
MSISFTSATSILRHEFERLRSFVGLWFRRIPPLLKIALGMQVGLTLIIIGVLRLGHLGIPSEIYNPPQVYLPGNPLPALVEVALCANYAHQKFSTTAEIDGRTFYFTYIFEDRVIIHTAVRAEDYNIGELVTLWGMPSGIQRHGATILVSWGLRSATLYANYFNPDRPIAFLAYDTDAVETAAWRGFVNKTGDIESTD